MSSSTASSSLSSNIYITVPVTDPVKLKPHEVCRNVEVVLLKKLKKQFEGKCSYHGYIQRDSIKIVHVTCGKIKDIHLNGDVEYTVTYNASICNPLEGSVIKAKVVNQNMYGILAESTKVLEIVIPKKDSDINQNLIKINDEIHIEVLAKKFEIGDRKIVVVGKIGKEKNKKLLDAAVASELAERDEEEDDDEDGDEEEDGEDEDDDEEGDEEGEGEDEKERDDKNSSADEEEDEEEEEVEDKEEDEEEDDMDVIDDGDGDGDGDDDDDVDMDDDDI
jgi:DNA-directed RNA polymerase subunit E'/Rpb7